MFRHLLSILFLGYLLSQISSDTNVKKPKQHIKLCGVLLDNFLQSLCKDNYAQKKRNGKLDEDWMDEDESMKNEVSFPNGIDFSNDVAFGSKLGSDHKVRLANKIPLTNDIQQKWHYPFKPRNLAFRMLPKRTKRGIVEECCLNPCSVDNLLLYCGDS